MRPNFCRQCGARLNQNTWRAVLRGAQCPACAKRNGSVWRTPVIVAALVALAAFGFGRYRRPAPPPLIIQRAANSPLPDSPIDQNPDPKLATNTPKSDPASVTIARAATDDAVYICGARTKKGTPCRRRVHFAGERCFQHKGMPAILPLERLRIDPNATSK